MLQKARPRPDFRYTDFLVSASAHKKKRNDDLNFSKARRKKKNTGVRFGDPLFEEKTRKKKEKMISKEDFLNPEDIPELFSGTPQYVRLKREFLRCPGARDLRGPPRFSRVTKKFPPRGRYLPILPY